jgi:hypothetical protein
MKSYWLSPILLLAAAAGCSMPVLYDTAGRPVKDPHFEAQADWLWLAVDSAEGGVRAVVEMQMAAPGGEVRSWDVAGLRLWTGDGTPLAPARIRRSNVRCWPEAPRGARCRGAPDDPKGCTWQMQPWESECYYILCAEFSLKRLPDPDEPIVVKLGSLLTVLQLAAAR